MPGPAGQELKDRRRRSAAFLLVDIVDDDIPVLGTPRLKIQVIDLEHLIGTWRAQIKSGPPPMHFSFYAFCARKPVSSTLYIHVDTSRTRALATRHPASCPLAAGQARALAGWPRACIQSVSEFWIMHA